MPGLPAAVRRRRPTRAVPVRLSWPEAVVSIVRVLAANATIGFLAYHKMLPPEAAVAALAVATAPAAIGLILAGQRRPR